MQIGVDVGGTNTDGVIMSDGKVIVSNKTVTTANVGDGVFNVIKTVLDKGSIQPSQLMDQNHWDFKSLEDKLEGNLED